MKLKTTTTDVQLTAFSIPGHQLATWSKGRLKTVRFGQWTVAKYVYFTYKSHTVMGAERICRQHYTPTRFPGEPRWQFPVWEITPFERDVYKWDYSRVKVGWFGSFLMKHIIEPYLRPKNRTKKIR